VEAEELGKFLTLKALLVTDTLELFSLAQTAGSLNQATTFQENTFSRFVD
jgi:hypothetical protein